MAGIVISQRLAGFPETIVERRHLRILMKHVVDHRVDFMRKEHA
jgi:hypothetical protein